MPNRDTLKLLIALALLLPCLGCEEILYEVFYGKEMEITTDTAPAGNVGSPYRWEVHMEIKNEPNDRAYDYNFRLIEGVLPKGLAFRVVNEAYALVEGTPLEAGNFSIRVYVSSDKLRIEDVENGVDEDYRYGIDVGGYVYDSSDSRMFEIVIRPS